MKKEAKGREPAGRDPLNRQSIMKAAIAIADREGLQALSMRRLGQGTARGGHGAVPPF